VSVALGPSGILVSLTSDGDHTKIGDSEQIFSCEATKEGIRSLPCHARGALILTVLDSMLAILDASQAAKQILYGAIILVLAALYALASAGE
jgi:hypothetical protein